MRLGWDALSLRKTGPEGFCFENRGGWGQCHPERATAWNDEQGSNIALYGMNGHQIQQASCRQPEWEPGGSRGV